MTMFNSKNYDEINVTNLPLWLEKFLYSDAERLSMYFNPPSRDSSYYEGMQNMQQSEVNNQKINLLKELLSRNK